MSNPTSEIPARSGNISPLLDLVLKHVPGPLVKPDAPLQLMVTNIEWSEFVGRVVTGRLAAGKLLCPPMQ